MTSKEINEALTSGTSFDDIVNQVMDRVGSGGDHPTNHELGACASYVHHVSAAIGEGTLDESDVPWLLVLKIGLILGMNYLSTHRPDDDDPWNVEWLKSQGFVRHDDADKGYCYWALSGLSTEGQPIFEISYAEGNDIKVPWLYCDLLDGESVSLPVPETKGDIRDICSALSFDLAEDKETTCGAG